ncbi:MAG: hypothetical protein ACJ76Y_13585 [Thermoanaerobaculia bacterium]|jgi:hypothetical protein
MKRFPVSGEMTRLNGAALRISAERLRDGGWEALLEETLARVHGGGPTCTEFNCNVYAPPPPG